MVPRPPTRPGGLPSRSKRLGPTPGPPRRPGGFSQLVPGPPICPGGLLSRSTFNRSGLAPGPPRQPGGFSQFVPRPPRRPGGLLSRSRARLGANRHTIKASVSVTCFIPLPTAGLARCYMAAGWETARRPGTERVGENRCGDRLIFKTDRHRRGRYHSAESIRFESGDLQRSRRGCRAAG